MNHNANIAAQSDSIIDLLVAQCVDLEALLSLARRETKAAEQMDFEEVLRVVKDRATLGERLEVYHRQIADMRMRLGDAAEDGLKSEAAARAARLAANILAQDARSRPLLLAAHSEAEQSLSRLKQGRSGASAYLRRAERPEAIACDQRV